MDKINNNYYCVNEMVSGYGPVNQSSLVSLNSSVFFSSGVRLGKKLTPVTLSMSLIGVSANLSSLCVREGSCIIR